MKVFLHDYGAYPFSRQLAEQLSALGHEVTYAFFRDFPGPNTTHAHATSSNVEIRSLTLGQPFAKYNLIKRILQERAYGKILGNSIRSARPDIVLSANTPPHAQYAALTACKSIGAPLVTWLQDLYGLAVTRILGKRVPLVGQVAGAYFSALEQKILRASNHVITIADDFVAYLYAKGLPAECVSLIENWAPVANLARPPKANDWARRHKLDDKFVLLYSGTLGLKHKPALFAELARRYRDHPDVRVVVVSEGLGAAWLRDNAQGLSNLIVLPFQSSKDMGQVLATADILIATLDPDAGLFSVPSKILTYLCAGRPILAALPTGNLAARKVIQAQAGIVVEPHEVHAFFSAAEALRNDHVLRETFGRNACSYADAAFDIGRISGQFLRAMAVARAGANEPLGAPSPTW